MPRDGCLVSGADRVQEAAAAERVVGRENGVYDDPGVQAGIGLEHRRKTRQDLALLELESGIEPIGADSHGEELARLAALVDRLSCDAKLCGDLHVAQHLAHQIGKLSAMIE